MLSEDADRYIALRRVLGYKLAKTARHLQAFARFAADRGDSHIRTASPRSLGRPRRLGRRGLATAA